MSHHAISAVASHAYAKRRGTGILGPQGFTSRTRGVAGEVPPAATL